MGIAVIQRVNIYSVSIYTRVPILLRLLLPLNNGEYHLVSIFSDTVLQRLVKRAGKVIQLLRDAVQIVLPELHQILSSHTQYRELQQTAIVFKHMSKQRSKYERNLTFGMSFSSVWTVFFYGEALTFIKLHMVKSNWDNWIFS
jgi:hypothetical protein